MVKITKVNILILFLFLQFLFTFYVVRKNMICNRILNKMEMENVYLKQEIKLVKENSLHSYKVRDKALNPELIFKDRVGESLDLKRFIDNADYLLCFPRQTCPSCFENILQLIPKMREKLDDRLKVVCSRDDIRSFTVYSQVKGKKEIVYYADRNVIFPGMEIIPEDIPFILKINPDGDIHSLFVIDKEDPEYLFNYFNVFASTPK